jgi:hypothetical protein
VARTEADAVLEELVLRFRGACPRCRVRIARHWLWEVSVGKNRRIWRLLLRGYIQERHRLRTLEVPYHWIHERRTDPCRQRNERCSRTSR